MGYTKDEWLAKINARQSIISDMNKQGIDSSYEGRASLYKKMYNAPYTGSYEQNKSLLASTAKPSLQEAMFTPTAESTATSVISSVSSDSLARQIFGK